MDPHNADFERFGIDPDDPNAETIAGIIGFLLEHGVSESDIPQNPTRPELERRVWAHVFIGTQDLLPLVEAAPRAGIPLGDLEETIRLLGLPLTEDTRISVSDAEIIKLFANLTSLFGEEAARQITRTIGSAMSRIA